MTVNRIVLLLFAYLFGMAAGWLGGLFFGWLSVLAAGPLITILRFLGVGFLFTLGCSLEWKRAGLFAFLGTLALDAVDAGALHSGLSAVSFLSPRQPLTWLVLAAAAFGAFLGAHLVERWSDEEWLEHARTLIFSMLVN